MSTEWTPVFVLPNVELAEPIEGDFAALTPARDVRIANLKRTHPSFRRFLRRFSNNFGTKFQPTVLLLRQDAPRNFYEVGALASFRDLISFSVTSYNRALELKYPGGHRVLFGEAFALYPWMIDKNYEYVIGRTPAILGLHQIEKFRGQSSPTLFRLRLDNGAYDEPMARELLDRWHRRYETAEPAWPDIAVFRALNMAYHASLLPGATDTTFHDVGRLVSLWVSAFEILVHPGGDGHANRDKVFELIEQTTWELRASADCAHETGGPKKEVRRTLASWLYQRLYNCRNDFLHGNPVSRDQLQLPIPGRTIVEYAAPLFRLTLSTFLRLKFHRNIPPLSEAATMKFLTPQRTAEEALFTATQPPVAPKGRQARPTGRRR